MVFILFPNPSHLHFRLLFFLNYLLVNYWIYYYDHLIYSNDFYYLLYFIFIFMLSFPNYEHACFIFNEFFMIFATIYPNSSFNLICLLILVYLFILYLIISNPFHYSYIYFPNLNLVCYFTNFNFNFAFLYFIMNAII